MTENARYLSGFGNHFTTEAISGTLPHGQNSPQQVAHGLYAEQLSGTAFTRPRAHNQRSWLYRILPSVVHDEFQPMHRSLRNDAQTLASPSQTRWSPLPYPQQATDFIDGLVLMADNGDIAQHVGAAIFYFHVTTSMSDRFFYSADGEWLILIQEGQLQFKTELGVIDVTPGEIAVIPRGVKYQVILKSEKARGYICENFGIPFSLPELGPIGANGLANARDFLTPHAAFEDKSGHFQLVSKFHGALWQAKLNHSPLNVVAWHGNYAPYKYDLRLFNTMNTVSFDHADPSIFTVLTSASATPGVANLDFVIFPDRWVVAEHSFRPPYYHRNVMSEFMGLICGEYDAKGDDFAPGGASLHNCMSSHGPDAKTFLHAQTAALEPRRYQGTLAFMFESCFAWRMSEFAHNSAQRDVNYQRCWSDLPKQFSKA